MSDKKYCIVSFLSPSSIEISNLENELHDEQDFEKKCKLYEKLLELKGNSKRAIYVWDICNDEMEANEKARRINTKDNIYDIFIGETKKWLPFDDDTKTNNLEYQNKELTTLINNYRNEMKRNKELFNERVNDKKEKVKLN